MKWLKNGQGQKMLEQKFDSGEFNADTKPKDAYLTSKVFQNFSIDIFRVHFSNERKKRGLHLQMVHFKSDTENNPSDFENLEEESPSKKPKVEKYQHFG